MPRSRPKVYAHKRHKKVLKFTKGQLGSKHRLFRRANEAMLKSLFYAFRDRRNRKRNFRRLWITRINAAIAVVIQHIARIGGPVHHKTAES